MKPWQRYAVIAACAVLALAGAFSAGRFSAPEKVVEKVEEVEVFKDRWRVVEVKRATEIKVETKIVYRDKTTKPDGTIVEHEEERTDRRDESKTETNTEKVGERVVEKVVTVEKTVTLRPDWRVGVLVGVQWPQPLIPIAGPLVLGVHADRRIIGGLWAGLWIQTGGSFGASLSFEF